MEAVCRQHQLKLLFAASSVQNTLLVLGFLSLLLLSSKSQPRCKFYTNPTFTSKNERAALLQQRTRVTLKQIHRVSNNALKHTGPGYKIIIFVQKRPRNSSRIDICPAVNETSTNALCGLDGFLQLWRLQ